MNKNNRVKVGFAVECLNSALPRDRPVKDDVEGIILYFSDEISDSCWIILDFMDFSRNPIDVISEKVNMATGIPKANIHILTTHNHGASTEDCLDIPFIADKAAQGVLAARECAFEASMRYAVVNVNEQLNYIRRYYSNELKGKSTCFFGPNPGNHYEVSTFLRQTIYELENNKPLSFCDPSGESGKNVELMHQYLSLPPGDNKLQILFFEKTDGSPIGSMSRFAAHAVCCNSSDYYSSDYPYYFRQTMCEKLGGIAAFINGPCAEIAPGVASKESGGEKIIGEKLGLLAAEKIKRTVSNPVERFCDHTQNVALPIRSDILRNKKLKDEMLLIKKALQKGRETSLPVLKQLKERMLFFKLRDFLISKCWSTDNEIKQKKMSVEVQLGRLTLNDVTLLAFPGETFSATAHKVSALSDSTHLITATEHGRSVLYIVPEDEYGSGGYEVCACLVTPKAEEILIKSALEIMNL